jgi:voltage-gated potassium channel
VSDRPEKRLLIALSMLLVMIIFGTVGYKLLTGRHYDWLECLYMTVITLSTVGYGEIIDTSQFTGAKVFTVILILSGMGILLYSLSTVTSIMVEMDLREVFKRRKMGRDIKNLRNHTIVCGAGQTGTCIARELLDTGAHFVMVERDAERIETLRKLGDILCVRGDATNDETLIEAGIDHAAGLAAALSSEKDNLFLTLTARQLNPTVRIVARGLDESMNQKLRMAGANATVSPTIIGGLRMASVLIRPTVVSFLDTMLRDSKAAIRFEELHITSTSSFMNQTIRSTKLREDSNMLIVALRHPGSPNFEYNPSADTTLVAGMTLVVLGESKDIHKLKELHAEPV